MQRLVERVAIAREAVREHVDRNAVDSQREQYVALVGRQARDRRGDPREQLSRLRGLAGVVGEAGEVLEALARVRAQVAIAPRVTANRDARAVNRELVGPRRELAAALEAVEPRHDREQGV